jgi:hypothetical protein
MQLAAAKERCKRGVDLAGIVVADELVASPRNGRPAAVLRAE